MAQLDGLRFFAVLGVAWHHWVPKEYHFHVPWNAGVQLFFVLSGFLITGILIRCRIAVENRQISKPQALKQFYIRRFLRIFPLYYFVLFTAALLNLEAVRTSLGWHLSYLSNYYFIHLGYFDSYLSHFWTLAVEEQFYLFWPFIILFIPRKFILVSMFTVIILAPIHRIMGGAEYFNSSVYGIATLDSLDCLSMGALLALGKSKYLDSSLLKWIKKYKHIIAWSSIAAYVLIFIIGFFGKWNYITASFQGTCLSIGFAYLILRTSEGLSGIFGKILKWPWINYLGRISYGLYVYHLFALIFIPRMYAFFGAEALVKENFALNILSMTIWTVAVASLSWFLFEKPINNLKRFFPYY